MRFRTLLFNLCLLSVLFQPPANGKPRKIEIGYCGSLKEMDATKAAAFDYMEIRTSEVAALSDAEYETLAAKVRQIGIAVPVGYWFVPASIKLTGPQIDKEQQMSYLRKALDRVSKLGVRLIVFGSGDARRIPDGFSRKEAFQQLIEFCQRVGPLAAANNITIAIEAQRRQECNIINTAAEGLELVKAVNHPNIQLMIDFYHFAVEKEDPAIILKAKDHIRHLHMANPTGRVFPLNAEEYDYAPFFQNLRKIGYAGRISLEARSSDFAKESPQAIAFLHSALAQ